jgi:hypothetical protein
MAPSACPPVQNPRSAFDVERDDPTRLIDSRMDKRRESFEEDVHESRELPDEPPPGWART